MASTRLMQSRSIGLYATSTGIPSTMRTALLHGQLCYDNAKRSFHSGTLRRRIPLIDPRLLARLQFSSSLPDASSSFSPSASVTIREADSHEDIGPHQISNGNDLLNNQVLDNVQTDYSHINHPTYYISTTADFIPPPSLQEDVHVASGPVYDSSSRHKYSQTDFKSSPRLVKVHPRSSSTENFANKINLHYRESLNGYKYRMLKTSPLTNELLSSALPDQDFTPSKTNPSASLLLEEEELHFHNGNNHHSPVLQPQQFFPSSMNDVLSSRWWRTLCQNVVHPSMSSPPTSSKSNQHPYQSASMRNRRTSHLLEEIINNNSYNTQASPDEDENIHARIRVRSVQVASSIDVVAVLSKVFGGGVARSSQYDATLVETNDSNSNAEHGATIKKSNHPLSEFFESSPPLRHVFGRTNIIVQLSPPPSECPPSLAPSIPRYVAIYRFGSVVFFNVTTKEATKLIEEIKKHSVDPIAVGFERREFFEMAIQPDLETATGKITADRAMVRELDMNTVGVISNIMGQTVALDWHNDTVDELLANFSNINSSVERTGSFTSMERNMLFQVVARNNSLFIDMVAKLGIKDRSDTAWHLSQYEGLHYGMREQFDLDERFRHIEFKLDLIQQNAKFFLEVLHAQKANTLEWVIVALISFECCLMCMDMSGYGEKFFSTFAYFQ